MAARAKEPATAAPQAEQFYTLTLGSSLKDQPSKRFYSLRYEFKPASIDTSRPGSLHKSSENKVTVEHPNNQPGKPKVSFQGMSEDCKDLDAVIFFDGKTFRLEQLHRAVKTLRHVRMPGESAAAAAAGSSPNEEDTPKPPTRCQGMDHVEEIFVGQQPETTVIPGKKNGKSSSSSSNSKKGMGRGKNSSPATSSANKKRSHVQAAAESPPLHVDIDSELEALKRAKTTNENVERIEVNGSEEGVVVGEEHESDYEIEDIDVSDEEGGDEGGSGGGGGGGSGGGEMSSKVEVEVERERERESSSESGSESGSGSGSGSSSESEDESESLGDI